jgi:hypothetical protein
MSPSSYYNWFCAANSLARIANNAATIQTIQLGHAKPTIYSTRKGVDINHEQKRHKAVSEVLPPEDIPVSSPSQQTRSEKSEIIAEQSEGSEPPPRIPERFRLSADESATVSSPIQPLRSSAVPSSKIARLFHYGG